MCIRDRPINYKMPTLIYNKDLVKAPPTSSIVAVRPVTALSLIHIYWLPGR